MERGKLYPIPVRAKVDLNTDLLLTELQQMLKKDRSKVIRLILVDFFNRNIDLIDKHSNSKVDSTVLVETLLKDFFDFNRETINKYHKFNEKKTSI